MHEWLKGNEPDKQCSAGALGCSETLAHNEIDFSRLFSNLQLPLSVITDVDMFILLIILLIYPSAQHSNHGLSEATPPTPAEYAQGLPLSCTLCGRWVCGQVGVPVSDAVQFARVVLPTLQYSTTIVQSVTN